MRKQIKLAAVASAAALLAIGASMTAFAAAGWVEEDGVWYYYDSDGNRVEDEWKKSGDNWYWLDSEDNGAMATDKLIEDDDNTYYVDTNGVMVANTWVMVVNEDQDDDDDPAEYNYYYMGSNGKAYKQTGDSISKKTINGKTYAFDEDGKMLYGWVSKDGTLQNGEDDWFVDGSSDNAMYYFGSWEDGSMKTGWQKIYVHDPEKDDDYEYWFNFKSNGQRRYHTAEDATWKSNGKYYHFTPQGVMAYEWFEFSSDADYASTDSWRYFSSPEDGAELVKGWFKVVPPTDDNSFYERDNTFATSDSEDESERWYYAKDKGVLAEGEIKKIKGKYYGFFPDGTSKAARMLTGLCALHTNGSEIIDVYYNDMDSDDLDEFMDGMEGKSGMLDDGSAVYLYYFGADNDQDYDGALKTGNVNISLDGDSYSFYFKKNGGAESRGRSMAGIDDGYVYKFGQKIKADSDEKYIVVIATGDTGTDGAKVVDLDSSDIRNTKIGEYAELTRESGYDKKDDETITYITGFTKDMFLVNTSGKIQTGKKSGTKDGDDWYWYTGKGNASEGKGNICVYANSKNFKNMLWPDDYSSTTIGSDWETVFEPKIFSSLSDVEDSEEEDGN